MRDGTWSRGPGYMLHCHHAMMQAMECSTCMFLYTLLTQYNLGPNKYYILCLVRVHTGHDNVLVHTWLTSDHIVQFSTLGQKP